MSFEPIVLQLDPVLFQVKGQTEQEQLQSDIGFAPHEKASELAVAFEYAKGALYLDGAIHPQKRSPLCKNSSQNLISLQ